MRWRGEGRRSWGNAISSLPPRKRKCRRNYVLDGIVLAAQKDVLSPPPLGNPSTSAAHLEFHPERGAARQAEKAHSEDDQVERCSSKEVYDLGSAPCPSNSTALVGSPKNAAAPTQRGVARTSVLSSRRACQYPILRGCE